MRALSNLLWWVALIAVAMISASAVAVGIYGFLVGDNSIGMTCVGVLVGVLVFMKIIKPGRNG